MIPTTEISGGSLDALMVYLALLGILLVVGTIIRLKVPFFKKYYIPASLIAGFIGLLMGPYFLNIIPKHIISCWSSLSGKLIVFVFAPILMGKKKSSGKMARTTINGVCSAYFGCFGQYFVPLILSVLLFVPLFKINPLFGTTFEQGWAGGHGTASGMLAVFEELGWAEGQSIAVTNATIGLLTGIFGGVILINIAARKGWTAHLDASNGKVGLENKEEELYTENRKTDTTLSISGGVIDNLAFHVAVLSFAVVLGWIFNKLLKMYLNFSVSWFVTAMFAGGLVQLVLNRTKWSDAIDMKVMSRIQGVSLEFLVAGAVSALNVSVVVAYAVPLFITSLAMIAFMLFYTLVFNRRMFGKDWFENSMMIYGMYCGVAATGMLLVKVCDPENKSDALSNYAVRSPFTAWSIGGGVITSLCPIWVSNRGAGMIALIFLAGMVVSGLLPFVLKTYYKKTN